MEVMNGAIGVHPFSDGDMGQRIVEPAIAIAVIGVVPEDQVSRQDLPRVGIKFTGVQHEPVDGCGGASLAGWQRDQPFPERQPAARVHGLHVAAAIGRVADALHLELAQPQPQPLARAADQRPASFQCQ